MSRTTKIVVVMIIWSVACSMSGPESGPRLISRVTTTARERLLASATSTAFVLPPSLTPEATALEFYTNTPSATPSRVSTPTATSLPPSITPTSTITPTAPPSYTPTPTFICAYKWFMDNGPPGCPDGPSIEIRLGFQQFERGFMIWVSDEDIIVVVFERPSYPAWVWTADEWVRGMSESDLEPPAGLVLPVRNFGWVWQREASIRHQVGWATAQEQEYRGYSQVDVVDGTRYIQDNEGHILVLPADQSSWEKQ